jgi:hypothetical protein
VGGRFHRERGASKSHAAGLPMGTLVTATGSGATPGEDGKARGGCAVARAAALQPASPQAAVVKGCSVWPGRRAAHQPPAARQGQAAADPSKNRQQTPTHPCFLYSANQMALNQPFAPGGRVGGLLLCPGPFQVLTVNLLPHPPTSSPPRAPPPAPPPTPHPHTSTHTHTHTHPPTHTTTPVHPPSGARR